MRITPLEVGKKYVYHRYFRKEKNPVTIEVMKRERMELPDGSKVDCLVLHPVIDTKGMFSKRSETRIWLTDDARRLPVQIRSKFPFGTITLRLREMVLPGPRRQRRAAEAWPTTRPTSSRVTTVPVAGRRNKVDPSLLAAPPAGRSLLRRLPRPRFPTCSRRGTCAPSSPAWPPPRARGVVSSCSSAGT